MCRSTQVLSSGAIASLRVLFAPGGCTRGAEVPVPGVIMSKRRALLVHELPQKKPRCVPEAQPGPGPVLALHRARELPVRAPAHVQKRRKSSRCCREEEEEEEKEVRVHEHELLDREPPRKLTAQRVTNCNRASGTFSGATRCTEQHAEGTPAKARARRKVNADVISI